MTICSGERAEEVAEAYIQGSLSEFETERFEDHYFDCPPCFAYLQTMQAVQQELASRPAMESYVRHRWRARIFAAGSIAAALVLGVLLFHNVRERREPAPVTIASNGHVDAPVAASPSLPAAPSTPSASKSNPEPSPAASPSATQPGEVAQLADLSLPPFSASTLRGGEVEDSFTTGMQAYTQGDCAAAIPSLASVPAENEDATAAQFYTAACQLDGHKLDAAISGFKAVIRAGDSPQLEAANYYLAQAMLARGDAAAAKESLDRTIALHGDYEQLAHDQLQRLKK
jgi:TolA-binding protein